MRKGRADISRLHQHEDSNTEDDGGEEPEDERYVTKIVIEVINPNIEPEDEE